MQSQLLHRLALANMNTRNAFIYHSVLLSVIMISCIQEKSFRYSEIQQKRIEAFDLDYKDYCKLDMQSNFELNAVQCSFYGDYQNALDQAAKSISATRDPLDNILPGINSKADLINSLEEALQNPKEDSSKKASAQKMLYLLKTPPAKELFTDARPVSAINFIVGKAQDYHFALINEAHYNSQHRSFTYDLLKPLWDIGYRYLALETLTHTDSTIYERGYPIKETGYYTRDSNFGNLVRESLRIGYTLVPYETQNSYDGTLRDRDQAKNIYAQTLKRDKNGKVLVHAGYSHIAESGDASYEPMGLQLKTLVNQEILTIDQESMIGFSDVNKQHEYYQIASKQFKFSEPTVFLDKENKVIRDPLQHLSVDIQVYHPETRFEHRRPVWMKKKKTKQIPLLTELLDYEGHLIRAVKSGEAVDAVALDQFVITKEKVFLLGPGNYNLMLINCQGDMVAALTLEVN